MGPLGGVGDGGLAAFETALRDRATHEVPVGPDKPDRPADVGEPDDQLMREHLALMWPGYFADPSAAPPMPGIEVSAAANATLMASVLEHLPRLEASLGSIDVPIGFLAGARSPLPVDISTRATAEPVPRAWVEVADGAGHFPWHERPGSVRHALGRLVGLVGLSGAQDEDDGPPEALGFG